MKSATATAILPLFIIPLLAAFTAHAQFVKFNPGGDTTKTVTLEGYADVYYGFDFTKPGDANRAYFVSHNRHNEVNINLAYIGIRYASQNVRASFAPGFGTYMNANYAAERVTLRNIVEAAVGVRLFKNREVWIDAGVLPSPYTNETAISFDQLLYTRSFAPEYVPYYLSGVRLSLPLTKKLSTTLYLLNGWQQIEDVNEAPSFGGTLEYKPTTALSLYANVYTGSERSAVNPTYRRRNLFDFYALYNPNTKWAFTASAYRGSQRLRDASSNTRTGSRWWQTNAAARYSFTAKHSLSARGEYFSDPGEIMIVPVTAVQGFACSSFSLCYNLAVSSNALFRVEGRWFTSPKNVFNKRDVTPVDDNLWLIAGLTAKF